ncbi:MAG: hypothetical protein GXO40_04185 [Epsilonproteobacteria bacterium]|nr:hypothetical protein [Campylobacterota bacterium]
MKKLIMIAILGLFVVGCADLYNYNGSCNGSSSLTASQPACNSTTLKPQNSDDISYVDNY